MAESRSQTPNPYESPKVADGSGDQIDRQVKLSGAFATFPLDQHQIGVLWYSFSGARVYTVNGVEALRTRAFLPWGTDRFSIADDDPRMVEVRYKYFPFWRTQVYLDDELMVEELFPKLRWLFRSMCTVLLAEVVIVFLLLMVYLAFRFSLS